MRYPFGLVLDSAKHLAARKFHGHRKFALVLTLDPLGGCTSKCGSTSAAADGAEERRVLSVDQCLGALAECDAPIVRIRGGEPLEYPEIAALAREIVARGKHLFLCTDGVLIRRRLHMIAPETNFFWNVKLDGTESVHDARSGRPHLFLTAIDGIRAAKNAGFSVVVTTTIYPNTDVGDVADLFGMLHLMHVDGYSFTPAYQTKVCKDGSAAFHEKMRWKFCELSEAVGAYNVMNSPVYLEYLRGERELDCCAWASPVYGPQGWAAPCSVLKQGHEMSYRELLENTIWENYGRGMNPSCETCMCEAGYESAALVGANPKAGDLRKMLAWQFGGRLGERRVSTSKQS